MVGNYLPTRRLQEGKSTKDYVIGRHKYVVVLHIVQKTFTIEWNMSRNTCTYHKIKSVLGLLNFAVVFFIYTK
jgi:hypothetical protein